MRRTALALLCLTALLGAGAQALGSTAAGTVLVPERVGRAHPALLVMLPAAGERAETYLDAARAAQRAAGGTRLWVAVADVGSGPASAAVQYERLTAEVRAAGFADLRDEDVVVAAWSDAAPALSLIERAHDVAGSVALGSAAPPDVTLRVLGELDRGVPVVRTAVRPGPLLVLPAAGPAQLRGPGAGAVLGDLAESLFSDAGDLAGRLAGDRLVAAVRTAAEQERGAVCADLQRTTADLAAEDAARLVVQNRASAELVSPTPDGVAQGDLGGFLYDKAELADDGDVARVTTNSYTPPGQPAAEVMCKTKSRSAVAQAVHGTHLAVDATPPACADFTRDTLAWAVAQLSATAVERSGGVTVLPDLPKSAGPEWVFSPLLLHPADAATGRWEVQSPALVTQLSDTELDPTFAGNHYCKALSPLRALELVLEDTAPVLAAGS